MLERKSQKIAKMMLDFDLKYFDKNNLPKTHHSYFEDHSMVMTMLANGYSPEDYLILCNKGLPFRIPGHTTPPRADGQCYSRKIYNNEFLRFDLLAEIERDTASRRLSHEKGLGRHRWMWLTRLGLQVRFEEVNKDKPVMYVPVDVIEKKKYIDEYITFLLFDFPSMTKLYKQQKTVSILKQSMYDWTKGGK